MSSVSRCIAILTLWTIVVCVCCTSCGGYHQDKEIYVLPDIGKSIVSFKDAAEQVKCRMVGRDGIMIKILETPDVKAYFDNVFGVHRYRMYTDRELMTTERIINGRSANITERPYQVSVIVRDRHLCGGSIISEDIVLTAGHCLLDERNPIWVRAGSADLRRGELRRVTWRETHPLFVGNTFDYDVAVLRVSPPFDFTTSVQPVKLPDQGDPIEDWSNAVVSGWGNTNPRTESVSSVLQEAEVPVLPDRVCSGAYGILISPRMICAGYQNGYFDACQGDSGGPLVVDDILVGIVSWGYGCGEEDCPGVYTKVAEVRHWIHDVAGV